MVRFDKDKTVRGFCLLPTITLNWFLYDHKNRYYLQIAFLFWYVSLWLNATDEMIKDAGL